MYPSGYNVLLLEWASTALNLVPAQCRRERPLLEVVTNPDSKRRWILVKLNAQVAKQPQKSVVKLVV
jgi:hypothetical protein